jgi:UDP-glucose 4-epimerase
VVHLAGTSQPDPLRAQEVNLGGALNVLDAARAAERNERPRVVLCGSGAIYGRQSAFVLHEELAPHPASAAAVAALAAEQYGLVYRDAFDLPVNRLRIFRTFGPEEDAEHAGSSVVARFIRAALEGTSPVIYGDGQQTRDLVFVDNVVQAIERAIELDAADPLNIAAGEAVTINFLWNLVLDLVGKKRLAIEPTYLPPPTWEPKQARPQIARACKALGWAPSVRLREALARTVHYYQAQRAGDPNAWFAPRDELAIVDERRTTPPIGRSRRMPPPPPPPPPQAMRRGPVTPRPDMAVIKPAPRPDMAVIKPAPQSTIESLEELDIEWEPVPALPGLGR